MLPSRSAESLVGTVQILENLDISAHWLHRLTSMQWREPSKLSL